MKLENLIIHGIYKDKSESPEKFYTRLRDEVLAINDVSGAFSRRLKESFLKSRPTRGVFQNHEEEASKFSSEYLQNYYKDSDFVKFSKRSTELLRDLMPWNARQGIMVYLEYKDDDERTILIVAMLESNSSFRVDDVLGIKILETLTTDKLARAVKINVTDWLGASEEAHTYLSFIRGTRGRANYFENFIGASDLRSSEQNVKDLKLYVRQYCDELKLDFDSKNEIFGRVESYLRECHSGKSEVELDTIGVLLNKNNAQGFRNYLDSNEIEISDFFHIDSETHIANNFKRAKYSKRGFRLEFDIEEKDNIFKREGEKLIMSQDDPDWLAFLNDEFSNED